MNYLLFIDEENEKWTIYNDYALSAKLFKNSSKGYCSKLDFNNFFEMVTSRDWLDLNHYNDIQFSYDYALDVVIELGLDAIFEKVKSATHL